MIVNKTDKLQKFNIYFIATFFIVISLLVYYLIQNISYIQRDNIEQIVNTKTQVAKIMFEEIENRLDENIKNFATNKDIAPLLKNKEYKKLRDIILKDINTIVDMSCIYTKDKNIVIKNGSNIELLEKLKAQKTIIKKGFFTINIKGKNFYLMRTNTKIIDDTFGKVIGRLCFTVVLNDNLSFLYNLKDKLEVENLFLVSGYDFINGTKEVSLDIKKKILMQGHTINSNGIVISKTKLCERNNISLVMFIKNYRLNTARHTMIILFISIIFVVFIVFLILYLLLRTYIKKVLEQEEIMIAQSKHAAMGEMISMIAHQWRQPLSVISVGANNIIADVELENVNNEELKNISYDIVKKTQELSNTIEDFKNFFKPIKDIELFNIEDIFKSAIDIVGKSLENNDIDIKITYHTNKKIATYSRELMQVFLNIIQNAKDALVLNTIKNGSITIVVSDDTKHMKIVICDNGGGIDKAILPKIYDPYFSTKNAKNGTGLGLYMSKTIIEKHLHGTIDIYNSNVGACFVIKLPFEIK